MSQLILNRRLPLNLNILNSVFLFICLIYWSILYNYPIHLFFIDWLTYFYSFIYCFPPCAVRFHHILQTPSAKLCYSFVSICLSELVQCRSCVSLRSKRFQSSESSYCAKVRAEAKKKGWRGRGKGEEETLARKPHGFGKRPLIFHGSVHL